MRVILKGNPDIVLLEHADAIKLLKFKGLRSRKKRIVKKVLKRALLEVLAEIASRSDANPVQNEIVDPSLDLPSNPPFLKDT